MSKERDSIRSEIAALEDELDKRQNPRQAPKTAGDEILATLGQLEAMVKEVCGESFMDDESCGSYMDDDLDDDLDDGLDDDFEDEVFVAAEGQDPVVKPGAEDDIDQDYLDDVLKVEKNPASIVTDSSMLDAAPTGYVARLKSASSRLDRVATYCEQQGNEELALRIDKIANVIDARIKEMEARDA